VSPQSAFTIEPGSAAAAFDGVVSRLEQQQFAAAIWSRRLDVWTDDPSVQQKIANRLGWLNALDVVAPQVNRLEAFRDRVRASGLSDVVLLGMGGSSLAPEVIRRVLGRPDDVPRFRMLDSTDPAAVHDALENAASSLFVLASKSGTTVEPNAMAAEAKRRVETAGIRDWGSRFVAITDEGTDLHRRAVDNRFLDIFLNPADIGGRYSALSLFGMVPAALMGIALNPLLERARAMVEACRATDPLVNPGLALGALMGAAAKTGRDKLTLLAPARLESFGLWVEQLVAESTGKQGTGIVPIVGETAAAARGDDRMVVAVRLAGDGPDPRSLDALRDAGVPVMTINVPDTTGLAAEFFRWEMATATAGWILGVNPFDEPNVQQAKQATSTLLDSYAAERTLPHAAPDATHGGMQFTLSRRARESLGEQGVHRFLRLIEPRNYFALLTYAPPDRPVIDALLRGFAQRVAARRGCATMLGYGPRYLHSTGQLHKGGADNGVFLIITADAEADLPVPDAAFSFGVLELSQALGDFRSLDLIGRRVLRVHLQDLSEKTIKQLIEYVVPG